MLIVPIWRLMVFVVVNGSVVTPYFSQSAHMKNDHNQTDMKNDIRKIVENCAPCQLLKAKRIRAHKHFRANPADIPN